MEWTAEKQKFDEQIAREIVQEKRFDILRKNFPTATEMTLYSNEVYPYPYRRNSVLALLVQAEDAALTERFFKTYFDNELVADVERDFLEGTNQIGQAMDYHYFRDDLPDEVLQQEAAFLGKTFVANEKRRHSPERRKIYAFLKSEREKLAARKPVSLYFSTLETEVDRGNGRLMESEYVNEASVWLREKYPFRDLAFCNNAGHYIEQAEVTAALKKSFATQVFKQLRHPDAFFWAGDLLRNFEKQARGEVGFESGRELYFGLKNGIVVFNQTADNAPSNSKESTRELAYLQYGYDYGLVMGLNNAYLNERHDYEKILNHELAHGVDLRQEQADDKAFSESDFMKLADMALYVQRHPLVNFVARNYVHEARRSEVLARIAEKDEHGVPLLDAVNLMFRRYTALKLDKDKDGMAQMARAVQDNVKNYKAWKDMFYTFEAWTSVDNYYDDFQGYAFDFDSTAAKLEKSFYHKFLRLYGMRKDVEKALSAEVCQIAGKVLKPKEAVDDKVKKDGRAFYLWCKNLKDRLY